MSNQAKSPKANPTFDPSKCARMVVKGAGGAVAAILALGFLIDHRGDIAAIGSAIHDLWINHVYGSPLGFWAVWAVAFTFAACMAWAKCCVRKDKNNDVHGRNLALATLGWVIALILSGCSFESIGELGAYGGIAYCSLFLPVLWTVILAMSDALDSNSI